MLGLLFAAGCGWLSVNIAGESMSPTLRDGDSVLATRNVDQLDRGDVVGLRYPRDESKSFVQRIIGLPGEEIAMADGYVLIDGRRLDEAYVIEANRTDETWGPKRIADGEYFVMGDNRRDSFDSRSWGTLRRELIWAKLLDR